MQPRTTFVKGINPFKPFVRTRGTAIVIPAADVLAIRALRLKGTRWKIILDDYPYGQKAALRAANGIGPYKDINAEITAR